MCPIQMGKIESAMRTVIAFLGAFNRRNVSGMMRLVREDCVFEHYQPAPDGITVTGKDALTRFWQDYFSEFPQARMEIEEIYGFGERCVLRWKYHWVDAGGEKRYVRGVDIFRVEHDLICEKYSYMKGQLPG